MWEKAEGMISLLWFLLAVPVAVLLLTYGCFRLVFYVPRKKKIRPEFDLPPGKIYEPFHDRMRYWIREARAMNPEEFSIRSFDGLTLRGKYYECQPGAPIELMFHGYRGTAQRDLCGGVQRCFALGRNALVVDQRASASSDGHVITMGIRERHDCRAWVDYMIGHFGPEVKIVLTGISMGAATVLMAAGSDLPANVVAVLADCGYTSPKEIIIKVIRQIHLPVRLMYPLIRWGGKIWGGFDIEEYSPLEAMGTCHVPVIFFHGEDDDYVPCHMSRENFDACRSPKRILTVPGAGHGLSYPVAPEEYLEALAEVSHVWGIPTEVRKRKM